MVTNQALFIAGIFMFGGFTLSMLFLTFYIEFGEVEIKEVITGISSILFMMTGTIIMYNATSSGTPLNIWNMNKSEYVVTIALVAYGIIISAEYAAKLEFNNISDTETGRNIAIVISVVLLVIFSYMTYKMFGW